MQALFKSFINDLNIKPENKHLIVTHEGIIRMFYAICDGKLTDQVLDAEVIPLTAN